MFRDWVQARFGSNLAAVNKGVRREGGFYFFALRLAPVFLFFVINLLMGLTPMKAGLFYIVSQAGMLPATMVYVTGLSLPLSRLPAEFYPLILYCPLLRWKFPLSWQNGLWWTVLMEKPE